MSRIGLSPEGSVPLLVRVTPSLLRRLDAETKRLRSERRTGVTRSDVVREVLAAGLEPAGKSRRKARTSPEVQAYVESYKRFPEDEDWSLGRAALEEWEPWE